MSMFENFPYTNLHELNLEWVIEQIKKCYSPDNPPENIVISVNGESGEVTLYRDAHVVFPDIPSTQWNLYRHSDGKITGIEFNKDAPATRINGNLRFVIYDAGNPPPYPVVSVNGATGAIELYTEAYVEFPDLEGDNWGIQRKLNANTENEIMIGLMLNDDGDLSIIKGEDSIPVYSQDNPPPYPVRTVDGMTGNVNTWGYNQQQQINFPRPSSDDSWALGRTIDQGGNLSIKLMYDDNIRKCSAYMVYNDGVNTPTPVRLLTLEDIPSSSGVVSINGQTGAVTLYASNITLNANNNKTVETAINEKLNKTDVKDNLTTNDSGYALDAHQGKVISDELTQMNIVTIERLARDGLNTGANGNIPTLFTNTGTDFITAGCVLGKNYIVTPFVSGQSNIWYVKITDLSGNPVVNEIIDLRYIHIKLKSANNILPIPT